MMPNMVTEEQYANRFLEWFSVDDIDDAIDVFQDLCDNGFDPDEAFRVTVNLCS